jgi:hypothetical protein
MPLQHNGAETGSNFHRVRAGKGKTTLKTTAPVSYSIQTIRSHRIIDNVLLNGWVLAARSPNETKHYSANPTYEEGNKQSRHKSRHQLEDAEYYDCEPAAAGGADDGARQPTTITATAIIAAAAAASQQPQQQQRCPRARRPD